MLDDGTKRPHWRGWRRRFSAAPTEGAGPARCIIGVSTHRVAAMVRIGILAAIGVLLILPVRVIGAEGPAPSDPRAERGRAIANNICSPCHVVGANPEYSPILREPAPDFRAIANRQDVTADSLTAFLHGTPRMAAEPHIMPNPRLTDDMISEVVTYILSLRGQQRRP